MSARRDSHVDRLRGRDVQWPIPWQDVEALARSEDCRTSAYRCPAGKPTIGWGETDGVTLDMVWTPDQCDARFYQQVMRYTRRVEDLCTVSPNANQLGALVRLAYNIGLGALARSTVLRQHNAGNFEAAARAFGLWDKFTDPSTQTLRVSAGLTARRAVERARYLEPPADAPREPLPQAVESESSLTASPIARTGAVTAGTGLVAAASAIAEQAKDASAVAAKFHEIAAQVADWVGVPPLVLFGGLLAVVGWVVVSQRRKQRTEGWA